VILGVVGSPGFLTRLASLFTIALHVHAGFLLQQRRTINISNRITVFIPPFLPTQLAILIVPCSVFVASRALDVLSVILPLAATLLAWACLIAIKDGEKGITELEKLKYEAKGA
jgi:hypothetical protein